jgi:hypothetical protein
MFGPTGNAVMKKRNRSLIGTNVGTLRGVASETDRYMTILDRAKNKLEHAARMAIYERESVEARRRAHCESEVWGTGSRNDVRRNRGTYWSTARSTTGFAESVGDFLSELVRKLSTVVAEGAPVN